MRNLLLTLRSILLLFAVLITAPHVSAYDFEVDGIYYNIINDNEVAVVGTITGGDLRIPSSIHHYSVTAISDYAFSGCSELTSIYIPPSIKSIGYDAFRGCWLNKVEISDIAAWCKIDFNYLRWTTVTSKYDYTVTGYFGDRLYGVNNPLQVAAHFFVNAEEVIDLKIPENVDSISFGAFKGCQSLKSVDTGNSVKGIGGDAFSDCPQLKEITIGENVKHVGTFYYCCDNYSDDVPRDINPFRSSPIDRDTQLVSLIWNAVSCEESICLNTYWLDFGYPNYLENVVIGDNVYSLPSYFLYKCNKIQSITIPASVSLIDPDTFGFGTGLTEITCLGVVPPRIGGDYLSLPDGIVIYVPTDAVNNYLKAWGWNAYTILPMSFGKRLTVNLPENVNLADYAQMRLELNNADKTAYFILSDKFHYTFSGIGDSTECDIALYNQFGDVFGKIEGIQVNENVDTTFTSLLKPHDVTLIIKTPNGSDVTNECRITWLDENGDLLLQDNPIKRLPPGRKLVYQVTLPQELATAYTLPATNTYTVKEGNNTIVCQLAAIGQTRLIGKVKDAVNNQPLYGATVSATQTFAGGITKTLTARTDNQGQYSLEASSVHTALTVAALGYINKTIDCDMTSGSTVAEPDVALSPITGAVINVNLTYTPAHLQSDPAETQAWYSDYSNVDYEVYNKTTGRTIGGVHVQYPQIVLTEEVNDGDALEITATSRTDAFNPVRTTVTIVDQKATATFNILEKGKVSATFNKNINPQVVGTLYDTNGKLVKSANYSGSALTIDNLADGSYKLVTMGQSDFFNDIYDLEQFATAGLQNGVDYAQNAVTVTNGLISPVTISEVPYFNETKFYYTGENTSFSVNKPDIVVGNYLTFRAQVDFKEQYRDKVNDVQVIVELPESCQFYENSVVVGSNMGEYVIDGNSIIIPMVNWNDNVRLCAVPTRAGNFAPSAYVMFNFNGKIITQPIGSARVTAQDLYIRVPAIVAKTSIPISGTTRGQCNIDIYDNDVLIAQTTSLVNGTWSTKCELYEAYNLSSHKIYAVATTRDGLELRTKTACCLYDKNYIKVDSVSMLYYNPEMGQYDIVFDFISGTVSPSSYYFFPYKSWPNWRGSGTEPKVFTFVTEFTNNNPDIVSNVVINVFTSNGHIRKINASYDSTKDRWVASDRFIENSLPINISVSYYANTVKMPDAENVNNNLSASVITQMQEDMKSDINDGASLLDQLLELYVANENDEARITELEKEVCEYFGINEIVPVAISSQEEGLQLIEEIKQTLSDPVFSYGDNFINSNVSDLFNGTDSGHGIIYGDCRDYDEATMADRGFEQIMLTDSLAIYYKQTETQFIFVSFSNNISAIIPLETLNGGNLNVSLRNTFVENAQIFIEEASNNLTKVTDGLNTIKDFIDTFSNAVGYAYGKAKESFSKAMGSLKWLTAKRIAGDAFPTQSILEDGFKEQAKKSGKTMLDTQRMGNSVSRAMNSPIGKAFQKVLAAFDLISQISQGIDDVRTAIKIWNDVPKPCEDDQANANSIINRTEYIGGAAIAFYALNISSSVLAIQAAVGSAAALVPSVGVSLTTLLVDLGIIIAKGLACDVYHSAFERDANDLQSRIRQLKCEKEDEEDDVPEPPCPPVRPVHDPSGFVYEGVPSNRLQGVTATCYYKKTVEDMYGDEHEEVVLWDAENYGQQNPLLTDENGYYRWDVPIGMWQVKYEKEGYETTYSDWLPVPPPQLDVNIGMVQMRQPEVIKARAYPQAVELEFDKYMFPETLTAQNIKVTDEYGNDVPGTIELLNAEVDDPLAITSIRRAPGTGLTLASRVRFNADDPFYCNEVTLRVSHRVKSYADLEMNEDYAVTLPIEYEMEKIEVDSTVTMLYGDSRQLTVTVVPSYASQGKTLTVRSIAPMIAAADAETYTLDYNGQAVITVHGDLPGQTSLVYTIDGYDLTASTLVSVMMESQMTVQKPTATIASGSVVDKGTAVYLKCSTPGATIYYTLDGSCPCDPSPARKVYDGSPIIINGTVTIKAMATAPDLYDSEVATFVYRVGSGLKGDVNGDGEVNIADVNAAIDIILGNTADEPTMDRADVNSDGEVNIADVNALIDMILSPANDIRLDVNCDDLLHLDDLTMAPGDVRTVNVVLDHAARYSAMQCDITLPAGLSLLDVKVPGTSVTRTGNIGDTATRVVAYSMNKRQFAPQVPVLALTVKADETLAAGGRLLLTDVVLADNANKAWRIADGAAMVNMASGVNDLNAGEDRVWVEGHTLCISTPQDGTASLVTVNGIMRDLNVKAGVTRHEVEPGIYVVLLNGISHKVIVK